MATEIETKLLNPPKYAIINDADKPEPNLVVEYVEGVGYCYMTRSLAPYKMRYDGMGPRPSTTSMKAFGFDIVEREFQVDFAMVLPSTATYPDGSPRQWQSHLTAFSLPRVDLKRDYQ